MTPPSASRTPPHAERGEEYSARRGALDTDIQGVERLARRHEQAIALGSAEADVAADLGQADAADQLAFGIPNRDAAVADIAPGVARDPDVAVDVATQPVGPALDAVDHEVAEQLAVRDLVVGADGEGIDLALA